VLPAVVPKRRKTVHRVRAKIAKTLAERRFVVAAPDMVVAYAAVVTARMMDIPPDRQPERLHILTIQLAARAISSRVIRKASVRDSLPPRDRENAGRDFQGGRPRPVVFLELSVIGKL
jgi:hypothetical protein